MKEENVKAILKSTPQIYDQIAGDFSNTRGKWWAGINDFKKFASAGDQILDVGCGNGRMADVFKDLDINYLGVDNSVELINIARKRFSEQNNINFAVGDVTDLLLHENEYDLVLVIAVLHHLPTKELRLQALRQIYRVMKPGATLIMYNWNLWQFGYYKKYWPKLLNYSYKLSRGVWSIKDAFIPWKPIGGEHQRYIHSFTRGEMNRLLRKAGFRVESIGYENQGQLATFFNGYNLTVIAKK